MTIWKCGNSCDRAPLIRLRLLLLIEPFCSGSTSLVRCASYGYIFYFVHIKFRHGFHFNELPYVWFALFLSVQILQAFVYPAHSEALAESNIEMLRHARSPFAGNKINIHWNRGNEMENQIYAWAQNAYHSRNAFGNVSIVCE